MLLCRVRLVFISNEVGIKVGVIVTCAEPHDVVKTDPKDQFHLWLSSLRSSDNQIIGVRRKQKQKSSQHNSGLQVAPTSILQMLSLSISAARWSGVHELRPKAFASARPCSSKVCKNTITWLQYGGLNGRFFGREIGGGWVGREMKLRCACTWRAREWGWRRETKFLKRSSWNRNLPFSSDTL